MLKSIVIVYIFPIHILDTDRNVCRLPALLRVTVELLALMPYQLKRSVIKVLMGTQRVALQCHPHAFDFDNGWGGISSFMTICGKISLN